MFTTQLTLQSTPEPVILNEIQMVNGKEYV